MDSVHERILLAEEARERLPAVDLDEVSRIASTAYWAATRVGEELHVAESRALAALAESSLESDRMREQARRDLEIAEWASKTDTESRRGFVFDFLFAVGFPVVALSLVALLGAMFSETAARFAFAGFVVVFGGGTLAAFKTIFRGDGWRMMSDGLNRILMNSGGAIPAGLVVLFGLGGLGYIIHRDEQRKQGQELQARLATLNQAAAITFAALEARASVADTQEAVRTATAANWITVEGLPTAAGALLARADLQGLRRAELRVTSSSADNTTPSLTTFVTSKSGDTVRYADYVLGTVVSADLGKVTVEIKPNETRVFALPHGTLPPPVKSVVVVALSRSDGTALFLQTVDSVIFDLRR